MKRIIPVFTTTFLASCLAILTACTGPAPGNQNVSNTNASPPASEKQAPQQAMPTGGSIEVNSTPPGAAVVLISEDIGTPKTYGLTPTTVTGVIPGKYTVHLEKQGYKFFQKEVEVKEGVPVKVDAKLRKE
ncbi:MAG TPA: PEGA domain-containing protein [Blastocatellia bacterium]|nr:PEGA domain-containing protein [Blastocatellia bacterium]